MPLLPTGYWVDTYWVEDYWNGLYWPVYGVGAFVPAILPPGYQIPRYWPGSYWPANPSYWSKYGILPGPGPTGMNLIIKYAHFKRR